MVKEGLGIANMLSVPLISLAVLPFGGWELMDLHIFLVAGAAGLAILTIPALLQNWATALRVSARTSGILYAFDSTIAAIIGMIGGHFGFGEAQSLSLWGWVGILLVLIASICATLLSAES
jgi:threonine/homoserine efflux transporter RhtA